MSDGVEAHPTAALALIFLLAMGLAASTVIVLTYEPRQPTYISYFEGLLLMPPQYRLLPFYEAVRQGEFVGIQSYDEYATFMAKQVLHDTNQWNFFDAYGETLKALWLNESTTQTAYSVLQNNLLTFSVFGNTSCTVPYLNDWVIDHTHYMFTFDHWFYGTIYDADYPRFPVETALTWVGECKDFAMLDAALLEAVGWQTAMIAWHDPSNDAGYGYNVFYHAIFFVQVGNNEAEALSIIRSDWGATGEIVLWSLPDAGSEYNWVIFDPTWYVQAGETPIWLQHYISNSTWIDIANGTSTYWGDAGVISYQFTDGAFIDAINGTAPAPGTFKIFS